MKDMFWTCEICGCRNHVSITTCQKCKVKKGEKPGDKRAMVETEQLEFGFLDQCQPSKSKKKKTEQ